MGERRREKRKCWRKADYSIFPEKFFVRSEGILIERCIFAVEGASSLHNPRDVKE